MNTKPTKKEKEFVVTILEVIRQYRNLDFDIIASLETICKMVELFVKDDSDITLIAEAFKVSSEDK